MKSLIHRLREGRFNSLEDLILEAADSSPDTDSSDVFRLLASRIPKAEETIEIDRQLIAETVKEEEDRYDEGYNAGWNAALDEAENEVDITFNRIDRK